MRESNRTNVSAVALFTQSLDKFEENLQVGALDPVLYVTPARHLQMALNRLITANTPDAFQMMRCLSDRMNAGKNGAYSEYAILMMASGSNSNIFKDEVMAVIHTLMRVMRGEELELDFMWMSRINSNQGIAEFIKNYSTSDQMTVANSYKGNVAIGWASEGVIYSEEFETIVPLGKSVKEITLTATEFQTLRFVVDEDLLFDDDYRDDIPQVISTSVTVKADLGSFHIARPVQFTPTASAAMEALNCQGFTGNILGPLSVKLPGPFFACKLNIASFDSGTSWVIGNIQIIPPSLRT